MQTRLKQFRRAAIAPEQSTMDVSPTMIWAALGFILLIIEVFTLSFVVLFFGVAALVIALLKYTTGLSNLAVELLIFATLGGACLLAFRKKLRQTFNNRGGITTDTSSVIEVSAAIAPQKSAKIEYQGTLWDAYNESESALTPGQKAVVVRTEGIKLVIKPYQS